VSQCVEGPWRDARSGEPQRSDSVRLRQPMSLLVTSEASQHHRIEDTHRDGVRRPINLGHKRDGARDASCVGAFVLRSIVL
jgi:hypothetical protein